MTPDPADRPALVIVYGDVNSTLAAALVCSKTGIPFAHVEAGLRSFDMTMPEEVNRRVTDILSDLLFVTSPEALDNLAREGVDLPRCHFVGNPMIDTLLAHLARFDPEPDARAPGPGRAVRGGDAPPAGERGHRRRPPGAWSRRSTSWPRGCRSCCRSIRGGARR